MKIELTKLVSPVISFLRRFHTIIFFLVVSVGLGVAILVLLSIITTSGTISNTANESVSGSFDEDTIKQIKELGTGELTQPGSRPSPFAE